MIQKESILIESWTTMILRTSWGWFKQWEIKNRTSISPCIENNAQTSSYRYVRFHIPLLNRFISKTNLFGFGNSSISGAIFQKNYTSYFQLILCFWHLPVILFWHSHFPYPRGALCKCCIWLRFTTYLQQCHFALFMRYDVREQTPQVCTIIRQGVGAHMS